MDWKLWPILATTAMHTLFLSKFSYDLEQSPVTSIVAFTEIQSVSTQIGYKSICNFSHFFWILLSYLEIHSIMVCPAVSAFVKFFASDATTRLSRELGDNARIMWCMQEWMVSAQKPCKTAQAEQIVAVQILHFSSEPKTRRFPQLVTNILEGEKR